MEKNQDGLTPGQQVDFATLQRIERSRQPDAQAERARNLDTKPEVRRGRSAKAAAAD